MTRISQNISQNVSRNLLQRVPRNVPELKGLDLELRLLDLESKINRLEAGVGIFLVIFLLATIMAYGFVKNYVGFRG